MAKRRERPIQNPIRQDLIADIAKPVKGPATQVLAEPAHTPSVGEGGAEPQAPIPTTPKAKPAKPKTKRRALPRQKDGKSRWTEPSFVQIKARFVHEEAEEIERLRERLSKMTRCNISSSHLTRALWSLALQAGEELDAMEGKAPKLERPPHGNPVATAEYEDELARFLLRALKQLRPNG